MCYHKALQADLKTISEYYSASYTKAVAEQFEIRFYESGFSHRQTPIITSREKSIVGLSTWGLIPTWVKDLSKAKAIQSKTLNCISEEMYDKPSYRYSAKNGMRCLIPCTAFYEWRWFEGGKTKIPYLIKLKESNLFSLGGLFTEWKNPENNESIHSYTVLTTKANSVMEVIHNSKKRMPVIIPREYESDWLNDTLTRQDVESLCKSVDSDKIEYWTISKMITDRKVVNKNVPEIQSHTKYDLAGG
ncbi:MAG: SOS response-associated peptidase [Cyclobacteriaceae bacterium]